MLFGSSSLFFQEERSSQHGPEGRGIYGPVCKYKCTSPQNCAAKIFFSSLPVGKMSGFHHRSTN